MIRLFLDRPLAPSDLAPLEAAQEHYLTKVMRLAAGAELLVFNGVDGEHLATATPAGRRSLALTIGPQVRAQAAGPDLELLVAAVKRGPLETIVEKATELGVRAVRVVATRRTNTDRFRLDRLAAIAAEAAEQCGRLDVPRVTGPEPLDRLLDGWPAERRLLFCDEGAGWSGGASAPGAGEVSPALRALRALTTGPWAVLIGPEGGFAPEERERLRALSFATAVGLGPRILRADTAAVAALTLWQAVLGDWSGPAGAPS